MERIRAQRGSLLGAVSNDKPSVSVNYSYVVEHNPQNDFLLAPTESRVSYTTLNTSASHKERERLHTELSGLGIYNLPAPRLVKKSKSNKAFLKRKSRNQLMPASFKSALNPDKRKQPHLQEVEPRLYV